MSRKLTEQEILERIKKKFPNKFDYSQWNFISYRDKIKLICNDCGHIIETTPAILLASKTKYGCKQCSRNVRKYSNEEIIFKLNNIYGEDRFDYSKFRYTNARQKSILICKKCGCEFDSKIANLLRSRNIVEQCPCCYKKSISKDQNSFINEIKTKFGDKFDYSKVEYKNAKTKIILICNDCGTEFEITPDNLLNCEIGCPVCAEKSRINKRTHTTEEFIIKSKEIHERLQKLKVIEIEEKEYIEFKLTYYSSDPSENIPDMASVTCEGKKLEEGICASNVYPLGTRIVFNDGTELVVKDRGGKDFNSYNRIDVFIEREPGEDNITYLKRVNNLGIKHKTGYVIYPE